MSNTKTRKEHNREQTRKRYEYWRNCAIFIGAIEDETKLLADALEEAQRLKTENERLSNTLNNIKKTVRLMTLGEFKKYIESFPNDKVFPYGISYPFSWRGVYAEVAFKITEQSTTKAEILTNIQAALDETFIGWKGGEYHYNEDTDIHFESSEGRYTDGDYCLSMIAKITNRTAYRTPQEELVNLAFN